MWRKMAALVIIGIGLQFGLWDTTGNAYEYADTPTKPADGIHIPKRITLLEPIPYYVIPNALLNKPEGSFAPQTVNVIEAEVNWATSPNWWKIRTDAGERWIKTAPYQIEAPPPPVVSLMAETPLYAEPSEEEEPVAALSPQDVLVVDAEKAWFKSTDQQYNPKRWLRIHTTWLGDLWIHLHLDEIGTFEAADQTLYFAYVGYTRIPHMDYRTYPTDGSETHRFLHEIGRFRSVLGSFSQVETDQGTRWTPVTGQPLTAESGKLHRTVPAPLYTYPSPDEEEPELVPAGELQVVEKLGHDVYNENAADWYHVKTEQGEGWFNPTYADPENAEAEEAAIQLHMNVTTLYRYPNTSIVLKHGQIGPQTVYPLAGWTAPNGVRWYQIDSFVGKAWIQIQPYEDRIVPIHRESDMQIEGRIVHQGAFYRNEDGVYSFGQEAVGYEKDGKPLFYASFIARLNHFDIGGPDAEGWWTLKDAEGYAFQIKAGEPTARTFWQGQMAERVTLSGSPASPPKGGAPLLGLADIRSLFGAMTTVSKDHKEVLLSSRQYTINGFQPPGVTEGRRVHLTGLLYDFDVNDPNTASQVITLELSSRTAGGADVSPSEAERKLLYNLSNEIRLYDLSLDHPLKPGMDHLTAVFKVGERIVLQKQWDVKASSDGANTP